jgi:uncharacterized repeat protein (TIGR03803 family)
MVKTSWSVTILVFATCNFALAQQYKVLWNFGGTTVGDGATPVSSLVVDAHGNLYGTTEYGGSSSSPDCSNSGCGTVFEVSPSQNGEWTETVIYNFCTVSSCLDGAYPVSGLIFDAAGNLYGATSGGGPECLLGYPGCGTIFELSPTTGGGSWTEAVIYDFCTNEVSLCLDGAEPRGRLIVDRSGNLYGTAWTGGVNNAGNVFELSRSGSGWNETVLYNFCSIGEIGQFCEDGAAPDAGVAFDSSGNLYGTTQLGGSQKYTGGGVVYELSAGIKGWTETVLYALDAPDHKTGYGLHGEVNFDQLGNLYSTAFSGGSYQGGTLFRLSPKNPKELTFSFETSEGYGPLAGVLIDPRNSNLYGTTSAGGSANSGNVFELSDGKETVLHSFTGGTDGGGPSAALSASKTGALYGTASYGGTSNSGVVFEIAR